MTTNQIIQFQIVADEQYGHSIWVLTNEGKIFRRVLEELSRWKEMPGPYDAPEHAKLATQFLPSKLEEAKQDSLT